MKNKDFREKMFSLCQQWESSNKTREVFCQENGISIHSFSYWRTKYLLKQKSQDDKFVVIEPESSFQGKMVIKYPNGVNLDVPENTSFSTLKSLILLI